MVLAVRQTAVTGSNATGGGTVVFGLTPQSGNLLLAIFAAGGSFLPAAAGSGWTRQYSYSPGAGVPQGVAVYTKYAGASESTSQSPVGTLAAFNGYVMEVWEVSGVSGTWASDFQEEWHAYSQAASPTITTAAHNTAANNQLVLGLVSGERGWLTGTQGGAPTVGANGQNNDDLFYNDTFGTFSYPASAATDKAIATSGTNYQLAVTFHSNQDAVCYQFVSLNSSASGETANPVTLALGGVGFNVAAAADHTGPATLALTGVSLNAVELGTSTIGTVLALSGVNFTGTANDDHAHGTLVLTGVGLNAAAGAGETANPVTLALSGIGFSVAGTRKEAVTGSLVLAPVSFHAVGINFTGVAAIHFSTFGA